MNITHATYLKTPRRGIFIIADGQPAIIKLTSQFLLDRGIALLADTGNAVFPWVNNLACHLDGDETNYEPSNKIIGGTDDPVIVCMARRYRQAVEEGKLKSGPANIPTPEVARHEREDHFVRQEEAEPVFAFL